MKIVKPISGEYEISSEKGEKLSTKGLLSCMPVVVHYKNGNLGLLHYNTADHEKCVKAIKSKNSDPIQSITLYTCKLRATMKIQSGIFNKFSNDFPLSDIIIDTNHAKSVKNEYNLAQTRNPECFSITNDKNSEPLLDFESEIARYENSKYDTAPKLSTIHL